MPRSSAILAGLLAVLRGGLAAKVCEHRDGPMTVVDVENVPTIPPTGDVLLRDEPRDKVSYGQMTASPAPFTPISKNIFKAAVKDTHWTSTSAAMCVTNAPDILKRSTGCDYVATDAVPVNLQDLMPGASAAPRPVKPTPSQKYFICPPPNQWNTADSVAAKSEDRLATAVKYFKQMDDQCRKALQYYATTEHLSGTSGYNELLQGVQKKGINSTKEESLEIVQDVCRKSSLVDSIQADYPMRHPLSAVSFGLSYFSATSPLDTSQVRRFDRTTGKFSIALPAVVENVTASKKANQLSSTELIVGAPYSQADGRRCLLPTSLFLSQRFSDEMHKHVRDIMTNNDIYYVAVLARKLQGTDSYSCHFPDAESLLLAAFKYEPRDADPDAPGPLASAFAQPLVDFDPREVTARKAYEEVYDQWAFKCAKKCLKRCPHYHYLLDEKLQTTSQPAANPKSTPRSSRPRSPSPPKSSQQSVKRHGKAAKK